MPSIDVPKICAIPPCGPKPLGPYSPALRVGNTIYISGQASVDPETNKVKSGTFEEQLTQTFRNLRAALSAAGATTRDVVKVNIYLTDMSQFKALNAYYVTQFEPPYPARTTVGVKELPGNLLVEIDAIAVVSS